jgi:peptidoglycan/LPS O-acetylase OafA/YrhL
MIFRNDIQFLRGISVFAVILFHINNSYLPGGFLGVDIFFIISGYLITNIIVKKKIDNNFSLKEFYFARAKRILPALLFVLIITYIICYLTFLPLDLKIASRNSFFINLFLGNYNYYYFSSDYFGIKSSFDPYIHLWTLSLEEQFYLLYPILFIFFFNKNKQLIIKILLITFIISISFYFFSKNFNSIFYLLHGRIWQLLLGGAISIIHLKKINYEKVVFNYLALFGLILIVSSFFLITDIFLNNYRFIILAPTIGTFLIILNKKNKLINIFESKLFVFFGSISYSLYLWHQPILVFYKFSSFNFS